MGYVPVVAHHETKYNSDLAGWYPVQPFGYYYIANPCFCQRKLKNIEKLFWELKSILGIEGIGSVFVSDGDSENIFKKNVLGTKTKNNDDDIEITHKCRYKRCLLKE